MDSETKNIDVKESVRRSDDVSKSEAEIASPPPEVAGKELQRLLRKQDLHLMPVLAILYLMSFLDRGIIPCSLMYHELTIIGSIGNAKILGLSTDLKLVGNQYNWYGS
jgi:hypothetical protein